MDKATKITVVKGADTIGLMGEFKNGQPTGTVQVTCNGETVEVESSLDGSAVEEVVPEESQPEPVEEVKAEPAPEVKETPVVKEEAKPAESKNSKKKKGKNNK